MSIIKQILTLILCSLCHITIAEEKPNKIPKKAGLYSAIIPGAGQIYTEKYWKVPVIYAGFITSAYYINDSNNSYQLYKNSYLSRTEGNTNDEFQGEYSDADLRTLTDHYKRNREISILFFIGTYILNIIDASVTAHLFDYDVSNDLSIKIQPMLFSREKASGISLSINL